MKTKFIFTLSLFFLPFILQAQNANWYYGTWVSAHEGNHFDKVVISKSQQAGQLKAVFHLTCQNKPCDVVTRSAKKIMTDNKLSLYVKLSAPTTGRFYKIEIKPRGETGLLMMDTQYSKNKNASPVRKIFSFKRKGPQLKPEPSTKTMTFNPDKLEQPNGNPTPKPGPKPRPKTSAKGHTSGTPTTDMNPGSKSRPNHSKPSKVYLEKCNNCNQYRLYLSGKNTQEIIKPQVDSNDRGVCLIPALPPGNYKVEVIWAGKMDMPYSPPFPTKTFKAVSGKANSFTLHKK